MWDAGLENTWTWGQYGLRDDVQLGKCGLDDDVTFGMSRPEGDFWTQGRVDPGTWTLGQRAL